MEFEPTVSQQDLMTFSAHVQKIFYNNKETTLKLYNTGGEIVSYLANENTDVCPLINENSIQVLSKLNEGAYGAVFMIKIPGRSGDYVIKKSKNVPIEKKYIIGSTTLENIADIWEEKDNISAKVTISFNGGDKTKVFNNGDAVYYADFARICKYNGPINNIFTGKPIDLSPEDYICKKDVYSEYLISLLVGNMYEQGECINFIDTFAFATCKVDDPETLAQYTFMQKIDGNIFEYTEVGSQYNIASAKNKEDRLKAEIKYASLRKMFIKDDEVLGIILQVICSINKFHSKKISHNDLHGKNIFIEKITEDMVYEGKQIASDPYIYYEINGHIIKAPRQRYLIKIGDWGLACKYSSPQVLNYNIMSGKMSIKIPNFFIPAYDLMYCFRFLLMLFPTNEVCLKILDFTNLAVTDFKDYRPIVEKMMERHKDLTSEKLLFSGIFKNNIISKND